MSTRASLRRIAAKVQGYQQARIAQMTPEERLALLADMVDAQAAQLPQEQADILREYSALVPHSDMQKARAVYPLVWHGQLSRAEWERHKADMVFFRAGT